MIQDTIGPFVVSFYLDMNTGNLSIHFDETVKISSFDVTAITLRKNASALSPHITLTVNSTATLISDGTVVMVSLSEADQNAIKGEQFCNSTDECYLSHDSGVVNDRLNQPSPERTAEDALMASAIGTDFMAPELEQFVSMDLNNGRLILRFSETLYGPSVTFSELSLGAFAQVVALTTGDVVSSNTPNLELQLTNEDLNEIKKDPVVCFSRFFCGVQISARFATDYAGNYALATMTSLTPTTFIPDTTAPTIESFLLDLETATLIVNFDEVVTQFRSNAIVIQDAFNSTTDYQLDTDHPAFTTPTETINITLIPLDVNSIKARPGLAKDINSTYIRYTSRVAIDTSSLNAEERLDGVNPLKADYVAMDTTRPELLQFTTLDFDEGFLEVVFSEPVDPTSYNASRFTVQSTAARNTGVR